MNPSNADPLKPLFAHDGSAIFEHPWQAEVLAMANTLVKSGRFNADEWANALGHELALAVDAGAPDTMDTYYSAVISAIEHLLTDTVSKSELDDCKSEWIDAYRNTPHGQPVKRASR